MANLIGVAEGAESWKIDNTLYVVYKFPAGDLDAGPDIPMAWKVEDEEQWAVLTGSTDTDQNIDRRLTLDQARKMGLQYGGESKELANLQDPFKIDELEEAAKLRPWLRTPEFLSIYQESAAEGRRPTEEELKQTDWWRNSSQQQRAWFELVNTDPASATQSLNNNRLRVRRRLEELGMPNAPESLIQYLGDRFTHGRWSEIELDDAITRTVDPTAPGAIPLAGFTNASLPRGTISEFFGPEGGIRTLDRENAPEGKLYQLADGNHAVRMVIDGEPVWRLAPEGAQLDEATRIWGAPEQYGTNVNPLRFGAWQAVRSGDQMFIRTPDGDYELKGTGRQARFGGIDSAQQVDDVNPVGDADELADELADMASPMAFGKEEEVRQLLLDYLGPSVSAGFSESWISNWAGKMRRSPIAGEQLIRNLTSIAESNFKEYGPGAKYSDIAPQYKALFTNIWGETPDETDPLFMEELRKNDLELTRRRLTIEGIRQSKPNATNMAMTALARSPIGNEIVRAV